MSIEQKIRELLEEKQKMQAELAEEAQEEEILEAKDEDEEDLEDDEDSEIEGGDEDESEDDDESDEEDEDEDEDDEEDEKKSMKESSEYEYKADLGALFESTEFSDDFRAKAVEIFEAAVTVRVREEVAKLEEQVSIRALQESEELKEGLTDKVDGYLNYMVEQWMKQNELALDRGIRAELFESFISGMKGLFEQHYVNLPDDSVDVLQQALEENKKLESKLDEATQQLVEFNQVLRDIEKRDAIVEATAGLSDVDAEKFSELAEELSYEDAESFVGKLEAIRESFFSKRKAPKALTESIVSDEPVTLTEDAPKQKIDPSMQAYLSAIK